MMKTLFNEAQRQSLREVRLDLDKIKAAIMANDPATYGDYGEYEFDGSLRDRLDEIIYNHAYETTTRSGDGKVAQTKRMLAPLFALAKREGFGAAALKAWKDGLKAGKG